MTLTWLFAIALFLVLSMAFASGKTGSITISTARPYDTFSLSFESEVIDVTNFTSSGYQENVAGVFHCDIQFSGPYDQAETIAQGALLSTVFVTGGSTSFTVSTRVKTVRIETGVRNKADQISVSGTSSGTYSITI